MRLLFFISFLGLSACAQSVPHQDAYHIDTKIENREVASGGVAIGVKDGEFVAQKEVFVSEEMRRLQNDAFELEAKVYGGKRYMDNDGLYGALKQCRLKEARVTKQIVPMAEPRSYVIPEDDYEIGLNYHSQIIGVQRENLIARMERFKHYREILEQRADEYQNKIDQCEAFATAQK